MTVPPLRPGTWSIHRDQYVTTRQAAAVVEVRVGKQYGIDARRIEAERLGVLLGMR